MSIQETVISAVLQGYIKLGNVQNVIMMNV